MGRAATCVGFLAQLPITGFSRRLQSCAGDWTSRPNTRSVGRLKGGLTRCSRGAVDFAAPQGVWCELDRLLPSHRSEHGFLPIATEAFVFKTSEYVVNF